MALTLAAVVMRLPRLQRPEPGVDHATCCSNSAWRARLDDAALVDNDDAIRLPHRTESMRDHDHRAVFADRRHVALQGGLAFVVERTAGLVENQDPRVGEQSSCDGDALALPAGQPGSVFADDGVVSLGQFADEFVRTGELGRPASRVDGRSRIGNRDVFAHAAVEQEVLLQTRHRSDGATGRRRSRQCRYRRSSTRPCSGLYKRCTSFVSVLLPEPDRPTMPMNSPAAISRFKPCKNRSASGR